MRPKVTVGIPVYNGGVFFRQAIDSVINQTFGSLEIIISDNCSNDGTDLICLEYAALDSRIRFIRQNKNFGSIHNFLAVLSEAKGEYFMWAGADDFFDENWIAELLNICERQKCIAFGQVQYIDQYDYPIRSIANARRFNYTGPLILRILSFVFTPWTHGKMILCWGLFPREKLLEATLKAFSPRWGGAVDTIWVFSVLFYLEIKSVASVRLYKRVHKNAESTILAKQKSERAWAKLSSALATVLNINMLTAFLTLSPMSIRVLILSSLPVFYPIYILRSVWSVIQYKLKRS